MAFTLARHAADIFLLRACRQLPARLRFNWRMADERMPLADAAFRQQAIAPPRQSHAVDGIT